MASRTKVTILLVLLSCVYTKCDDEKQDMSSFTNEHLLRGSTNPKTDDFIPEDYTTSLNYDTTTDAIFDTTVDFDSKAEKSETTTDTNYITTDGATEKVFRRSDSEEVDSSTVPAFTTGDLDDATGPTSGELEGAETSGIRSPKTAGDTIHPPFTQETKPPQPARLNKSSTLRSWLEDPWLRPPAGILVPLRPMALNRALAVWNDLTSGGLNVSDIVVIGYDSNGVNWRSRHNLLGSGNGSGSGYKTVSEALSKLLLKYQGYTDMAGDATIQALTSSAKLVPFDSALFVVTDKQPADGQRLPQALSVLLEKRLKVFTIWTDPRHPSPESEDALQVLKNVSAHTEGDVLPYSMQVMEMESETNVASDAQWEPMEMPQGRAARVYPLEDAKMETLLVRRGGGGAISLGVPVESGVNALRVYIEGAVEHAVLYPPNDAPQIDLYNRTSVKSFSPTSRTNSLSPRDVYLVFPGASTDADVLSVLPVETKTVEDEPEPNAGTWHLSVRCDTCDYRLTVSAHARIRFEATLTEADVLRLRVTGPVYTVRESTLVDEYGNELSRLTFSFQPKTTSGDGPRISDPDQDLTVEVPYPQKDSAKGAKVYVKIVGRDLKGEPYVRLSGPINKHTETRISRSASIVFPDSPNELEIAEGISQRMYNARALYNDSNVLPNNRATSQVVNQRGSLLTTVQIGLSTRLYGAPGDSLQLHFEVTNYREQAVSFRFEATGELRFLRGISPTGQVIASGQTVNVIVSLIITAGTQAGARDLITFTAYGLEQVSISTYVYVINPDTVATDIWAPTMAHSFQGTCMGRLGDDCVQHVWSASIVARDAVGGLLRISSNPIGLVYDSNFIAGTREEVHATYRATCCAPRVMVTAVDAYGNANSYTIDISNYITPAGVAAITLGVFLAIALILLVAFLIYLCVRRRKESRELPYSTTTRRDIS